MVIQTSEVDATWLKIWGTLPPCLLCAFLSYFFIMPVTLIFRFIFYREPLCSVKGKQCCLFVNVCVFIFRTCFKFFAVLLTTAPTSICSCKFSTEHLQCLSEAYGGSFQWSCADNSVSRYFQYLQWSSNRPFKR